MKKKLVFIFLFIVLGFVALQIPVNTIAGAHVKFTLFDLLAPVSGAFMGTPLGVIAVVVMQLVNLTVHGFRGIDDSTVFKLVATLRFFPMMFGVWFFANAVSGKSSWKMLLVPCASIFLFNLHPVGRIAWIYSMFWTVPIIMWPLREKSLLARSLASTFVAHSVGSTIWIWAFSMPAAAWIGLIPITAMERGIFALGISASYILFNNLLALLVKSKLLTKVFSLDRRFLLSFLK